MSRTVSVQTMKPSLLILIRLNDTSRASIANTFDATYAPDQASRATAIAKRGGDFQAVLTNGTTGLTSAEIDQMKQLELVSALGAGYENIAVDHARARDIMLVNGAGTNADCVADHAFALLLAVVRDVPQLDGATRQGAWRDTLPMRPNVSGKRLGILGLGHIGHKVARRGAGFDMELGYHNRKPRDGESMPYFDSVMALAQWCDFLVVTPPGGPGTKHLVNRAVLEALGPEGFVVNVSRGSVVDTAALARRFARRDDCGRRAGRLRGRTAAACRVDRASQCGAHAACGRTIAGGGDCLGRQLSRQRRAPFCGRAGIDANLIALPRIAFRNGW